MSYELLTPFTQQNSKNLTGNLQAFGQLFASVDEPKQIVEAMGGTGQQSRVLREHWQCEHLVWERDLSCCEVLFGIDGLRVYSEEFPLTRRWKKHTLLVLDFNLFTLKHAYKLTPYFISGAGQVIFTDVARGKLHLHPQAYGLAKPTWAAYCVKLKQWCNSVGLELLASTQAPRSITYFLAKRSM